MEKDVIGEEDEDAESHDGKDNEPIPHNPIVKTNTFVI